MKDLIKTATIIDVRSPGEFMAGNIKGSLNIPLQEISQKQDELKKMKNIIVCCASGNRSKLAAMFLKQNGIECEDGGSWIELNKYC